MIKYLVFLLYVFCFSKCFGQIKIDGGFSDWENLVRKSIELVKQIDLSGRESKDVPNTILVRFYNDGTNEKVFIVE